LTRVDIRDIIRSNPDMKREIEATFLSVDRHFVRNRLNEAGFSLSSPEYLMRRITFEFPNVAPGHNKWARVRQEPDRITMAIKETLGPGINDNYEVELTVNDFNTAAEFLRGAGIRAKAFQENTREVWTRGSIEATIDTWPGLEPFVEIEGPNESEVRAASHELGFDFSQAVFGSIDYVYEKELGIAAKTINQLPEITFENPPRKIS